MVTPSIYSLKLIWLIHHSFCVSPAKSLALGVHFDTALPGRADQCLAATGDEKARRQPLNIPFPRRWERFVVRGVTSIPNPLHVLQKDLLAAAVIEFRGPAVGVAGDSLSGFKGAVIFQKIRDACRAK
jgi:hypothetical protein